MPPPDPAQQGNLQETLHERTLLNQLRVKSFSITPASIQPFEPATISWDVTIPADVASEIDVTIKLDGEIVPPSGSKQVTPITTHAYPLVARSEHTGRSLRTKVLNVEPAELVDAGLPRRSIEVEAQGITNILQAGSLSSRGDLQLTMQPPDAMNLRVPLVASIPNFFDADVNVDLTIALSLLIRPNGNRDLSAALRNVSVDVIFHLAEHIASLGSATAAQAIVQPMAADLIQSFLGAQIQNQVQALFKPIIQFFKDGWKGADPEKREYRLIAVNCEPEGIIFIGCPVPPPVVPPIVVSRGGTKRAVRTTSGRKRS
jgi:hypothetical protein